MAYVYPTHLKKTYFSKPLGCLEYDMKNIWIQYLFCLYCIDTPKCIMFDTFN